MRQRNTWYSLVLIAMLVLLVRLTLFLVETAQGGKYLPPDPDRWLAVARNVISGQGYALSTYGLSDEPKPTAMRGPTVVYFLAGTLWLLGDHPLSVVIAQWLLEIGTALTLFYIALEVFQDKRVTFVTSLLFAFYFPGAVFSFSAWSEPLFTLLLAGFILSFLQTLRQPVLWRFALCGVLLGLAMLARPVMQFYPLVVLFMLYWALERHWRQVLSRFSVFLVAFLVILLPWVVRNYLVFNTFIAGSTNHGKTFFESNFALGRKDYLIILGAEDSAQALRKVLEPRFGPSPDHPDLWSYATAKGINEIELDNLAFKEGLKIIQAFPTRYIAVSLVRFCHFWFHHRFVRTVLQGQLSIKGSIVAAYHLVLLGLAVAAFVSLRGPWLQAAVPLVVLIAYHAAIYSLTHAIGRYSVPIMPYVMVFAARTIVALLPETIRLRFLSAA